MKWEQLALMTQTRSLVYITFFVSSYCLKVISGDDDLPKRDDIGERRRKHELKVLAGAGIKSEDDAVNEPGTLETDEGSDMEEDSDPGVSEDEFYRETKQIRDAKLAAKAKIYARFVYTLCYRKYYRQKPVGFQVFTTKDNLMCAKVHFQFIIGIDGLVFHSSVVLEFLFNDSK